MPQTLLRTGLVVGCLMFVSIGCSAPPATDEPTAISESRLTITPTPTIETVSPQTATPQPRPTRLATRAVTLTPLPPLPPTATPSALADWQSVAVADSGLLLAVPPDWVDVGGLLEGGVDANEMPLLFYANSKETGQQLLAGEPIATGRFLAIVPITINIPSSPTELLNTLISGQRDPFRLVNRLATGIPAVYADVRQDPLGRFGNSAQSLRIRTILLPHPGNQPPMLLLIGTSQKSWRRYEGQFLQLARSLQWSESVERRVEQGVIFNGDTLSEVLGNRRTDLWTFSAEAGAYAGITLQPNTPNIDFTLTLRGPSGRLVDASNFGLRGDEEVLLDTFLPEFGEYTIEIGESYGESGQYTLSLALSQIPMFDDGGDLMLGQNVAGEVSNRARPNWDFMGEAGQMITIILQPTTPRLDLYFSLIAPDGTELVNLDEGFAGDAEILVGYELPITGEYMVRVRSFADVRGDYTLSLSEGGEDTTNFYDAGDILYGDVWQEVLQADEVHIWFFAGRTNDEMSVLVTPLDSDLDLDVWLLSPEVELLRQVDAFAEGEAELIDYTLTEGGQYMVVVREFFGMAGAYEIALSSAAQVRLRNAGILSPTLLTEQTMLPTAKADIWQFAGETGQVVDLSLFAETSNDFLLTVLNPSGMPVFRVDNAGMGGVEQIVGFTLTESGIWAVQVEEFFDGGGGYRLLLQVAGDG